MQQWKSLFQKQRYFKFIVIVITLFSQPCIMQFFCIYINTEEGRGFYRNMSVKSKYKLKCVIFFLENATSSLE